MSSELPPNERPAQDNPTSTTSPSMFGGAFLILLGGFFLLQTLNIMPNFDFNWWALFLLIPIGYTLNNAFNVYNANGEKWTTESRSKVGWAAIMGVVFMTLMFGWDWGKIWPLFLIIGGLGVLFSSGMGKRAE